MKLVIVESPNKVTSISHYLGSKDYKVMASYGNIRELAVTGHGGYGIDIENGFKPDYEIDKEKWKVVEALRKEAAAAEEVILATDPDREGEAISWHLCQVLNLDVSKTKRLEFHEITKKAIEKAIQAPRTINLDVFAAQETRRIMDRIIGFDLSKYLKRITTQAKSGGRVQSATLKLLCDHDDEIEAFNPEEYWTLSLNVKINGVDEKLDLSSIDGEKPVLKTEEDVKKVTDRITGDLVLTKIEMEEKKTLPKPPYETSTMLRDARSKLKFSASKTTYLAQKLFEGIKINGEPVGLITYIRTDLTVMSDTFVDEARNFILRNKGKSYLSLAPMIGEKKSEAEKSQNAHEAIRPTNVNLRPEEIEKYFENNDLFRLYQLIYTRALGSLMPPKVDNIHTYTFEVNGLSFSCKKVHTVFKGFRTYYKEGEIGRDTQLDVKEEDVFKISEVKPEQHFTEPPNHYSDAKIIEIMKNEGIGRPSTYSITCENLKKNGYVEIEKGTMISNSLGKRACGILKRYFPEFVDKTYTSSMEVDLDNIAEGKVNELDYLNNFYKDFREKYKEASERIKKDQEDGTWYQLFQKPVGKCPECGADLILKFGKFGEFVGCSNYPKCKYIAPKKKDEPKVLEDKICPKCGKPLVEKKNKLGKTFIGCSGYPQCNYIEGAKEKRVYSEADFIKECPDCKTGHLVIRGRKKKFLGCTNYPKCRHMENYNPMDYKKPEDSGTNQNN